MSNQIHVYRKRHIFRDDDYIGKYDTNTRTIHLFEEHGDRQIDARNYFARNLHIRARVVVGSAESIAEATPVLTFPPEIEALKDPSRGDLTPEVVAWARQHLAPGDFNRHYHGRVDHLQPEDGAPDPSNQSDPSDTPTMRAWLINGRFLFAAFTREEATALWDDPMAGVVGGPTRLLSTAEGFTIAEEVYDLTLPPEQLPAHAMQLAQYVEGLTEARYLGQLEDDEDEQDEPEGSNQADTGTTTPPAPSSPPAPGPQPPAPRSTTTPPAETNKLGLPLDAPDTYNDLKKYLQDRDVTIPRNINKDDLIALYKSQMTAWNGTPPPVNPAKL